MKFDSLPKIKPMTLLLITFLVSLANGAPMPYPITLGGFSGFTTIDAFTFDSTGGIVILGYSGDTALVSSAPNFIAVYLPSGASTFQWAVQLSIGTNPVTSISVSPDDSQLLVLQG